MEIEIFSRALTMKIIVDISGEANDIDDIMFASTRNSMPQVMFDKVVNNDDDMATIIDAYHQERFELAHSY